MTNQPEFLTTEAQSALDDEMPQQEQSGWQGVLFKVLGRRLVVPLAEVGEILRYPPALTRVPGTRHWFLGVTNVRGRLLSVTDLNLFLGGGALVPGRRSRILVARPPGLQAGLLVEAVEGMRRFPQELQQEPIAPGDPLECYASGTLAQEGEAWPLFSIQTLAQSQAFREAAL